MHYGCQQITRVLPYMEGADGRVICGNVAVNFSSVKFYFSFVLNSLSYITHPKTNEE